MSFGFLGKNKYTGVVTDALTSDPVCDVLVTDGRNVTRTDSNGRFSLKGYYNSHFIYITVPSGYRCDSFYKRIAKGIKEYDFRLTKTNCNVSEGHSFIHISDSEIGAKENFDWLEKLKTAVVTKKPQFIIHTGDICYEYGLKNHIKAMNSDNMGCDVHYVIGNHDFVKGKYGEYLYESIYGPTWYSFDVGMVHYVVTPIRYGLDKLSGYMLNDSLLWLRNDLANVDKAKKVVMFNHTKSEEDDYVFLKGKLDLKQHNLIGWFFGHYHYNIVYTKNGVLNVSAPPPNGGGIDSSVAGYRLVNIDKMGEITTSMNYYRLPSTSQLSDAQWQTKLSGNVLFADTVIDGDRLYVATSFDDEPRDCGIYCLDKNNGKIIWKYRTSNSIKNSVIVNGDRLFAMDCEGKVCCLNKNDGTIIWQKQLSFDKKCLGTSNGLAFEENRLIAGNSVNVYCIDASSGNIMWEYTNSSAESSPSEFVIYKNYVFVSAHWNSLYCLDLQSGKLAWKIKDSKIRFRSSGPTVLDDRRLVASGDDSIIVVDFVDGKIINSTSVDSYSFSSSGKIVVNNDIIYVPSMNKGVVAFDIKANKKLWDFETQENILFSSPYANYGKKSVEKLTIADDKLIFGANDGCIYVLALDGCVIDKINVGSAVLNKIAVCNNRIYASTFDGQVCCYNL